jgi:hypothetical protein
VKLMPNRYGGGTFRSDVAEGDGKVSPSQRCRRGSRTPLTFLSRRRRSTSPRTGIRSGSVIPSCPKNSIEPKSSHIAMIEVEETTKPLASVDSAIAVIGWCHERRAQESIAGALVVGFQIVVPNVLGDDELEMPLAKRDNRMTQRNTRFKLSREIIHSLCMIFSATALACSSEAGTSNDNSADEASAVPGSTCEATDDYSAVDLEVTARDGRGKLMAKCTHANP